MDRRTKMLGPEGARGSGLEIGALHAPLLTKPEHDVLYVDYATTDALRAVQWDAAVDRDALVEVDIVWGEVPLSAALGRKVDFIAASHVIEHVPDLIGWLAELHAVLRPGGVLGLAVPDKRFTFDALRKESAVAEAVEAYVLGYRRPSLRQVFDVAALGVAVDIDQAWRGEFDPGSARAEVLGRLGPALTLVGRLHERPRYRDAHCWVFTPASFLDLAEELAVLGLFPFRIEAFHPTEPRQDEFHVRLTALAADDGEAAAASIRAAMACLATAPAPPGPAVEAERLRAELAAVRASSSWRLTAPLRAAARALKGLKRS
jgi:SAM-dependent methyltransferase